MPYWTFFGSENETEDPKTQRPRDPEAQKPRDPKARGQAFLWYSSMLGDEEFFDPKIGFF